jgi:hypothetical protein
VWSEHRVWHWMALAGGHMSAVTDPRRQFAPAAERNKEPILQVGGAVQRRGMTLLARWVTLRARWAGCIRLRCGNPKPLSW